MGSIIEELVESSIVLLVRNASISEITSPRFSMESIAVFLLFFLSTILTEAPNSNFSSTNVNNLSMIALVNFLHQQYD